jgi:hypothetical protein
LLGSRWREEKQEGPLIVSCDVWICHILFPLAVFYFILTTTVLLSTDEDVVQASQSIHHQMCNETLNNFVFPLAVAVQDE